MTNAYDTVHNNKLEDIMDKFNQIQSLVLIYMSAYFYSNVNQRIITPYLIIQYAMRVQSAWLSLNLYQDKCLD